MRIVLDTNVFIAALLAHGLCRKLVRRSLAQHALVSSAVLLEELRRTTRRKFGADPDAIPLIAALRERAEWIKPEPLPQRVCRDVDDDWVLATAVTGRADYIVTGDEDLLVLKKYGGIPILSPRQFLELLDRQS